MTKKSAELLPNEQNGIEYVDQETGETVVLTDDDRNLLISIEQQLALHWIQFSLALKTIRDKRLYLLRCASMRDYCIEYLKISRGHMYRYLQAADTFSETALKKISKSNVPMTSLLQLAKDDDIREMIEAGRVEIEDDRVVYADGTFEPLSEALERVRDAEQKKAKKKIDDFKDTVEKKDVLISDYRDRIKEKDKKIDELKHTIQELVTQKDVDPEKYVFVTQKREAADLLDDAEGRMLQIFGSLVGIPHELLDAELTARLARIIASLEAGVQRIREQYGAAVWIPGEHGKPGDLVPE